MTKRHPSHRLALLEVAAQLNVSAEDLRDPRVREQVETFFYIWFASLIAPGLGKVSVAGLDDAMLPPGTTDEMLESPCGMYSGRYIRSVLTKFKASLPPGKHLPDSMVAYLKNIGMTVH